MPDTSPVINLNEYHAAHGADLAEYAHLAAEGSGLPFDKRAALFADVKANLVTDVRQVCERNGVVPKAITILCDETAKGFDRRLAELTASTAGGHG